MNTDEQKTHEAIRIAIAEKLGWTHCVMRMSASNIFELFSQPSGIDEETRERETLPLYDLSANAALLLVEHMRKGGYCFTIMDSDAGFFVRFTRWDIGMFEASEATLPLAICKAFCAATGIQP